MSSSKNGDNISSKTFTFFYSLFVTLFGCVISIFVAIIKDITECHKEKLECSDGLFILSISFHFWIPVIAHFGCFGVLKQLENDCGVFGKLLRNEFTFPMFVIVISQIIIMLLHGIGYFIIKYGLNRSNTFFTSASSLTGLGVAGITLCILIVIKIFCESCFRNELHKSNGTMIEDKFISYSTDSEPLK